MAVAKANITITYTHKAKGQNAAKIVACIVLNLRFVILPQSWLYESFLKTLLHWHVIHILYTCIHSLHTHYPDKCNICLVLLLFMPIKMQGERKKKQDNYAWLPLLSKHLNWFVIFLVNSVMFFSEHICYCPILNKFNITGAT